MIFIFHRNIFEIILRVKYLNEIYFRLIIPEINPMQTVMTLYLFKGACYENMFVKEYTIFHRFNHFIWVDYQVASQPIWRPVKSCCQSSGLRTRDTGPDRIAATHCYKQTRSAGYPGCCIYPPNGIIAPTNLYSRFYSQHRAGRNLDIITVVLCFYV